MHPVTRQQHEHNEIRNQQRAIKGIGVVKTLESFIQQMLPEIGPNALRGVPCGQRGRQDEVRTEQVSWLKTPILPDSSAFALAISPASE